MSRAQGLRDLNRERSPTNYFDVETFCLNAARAPAQTRSALTAERGRDWGNAARAGARFTDQ